MASDIFSTNDWQTLPALVPAPGGAIVASADGACRLIGSEEARKLFRSGDVLIAHAAFISGRLKVPPARALFDVLELFAFVRPAAPFVPSPLGLARALGLLPPNTQEEAARSLRESAHALLAQLGALPEDARTQPRALAAALDRAGWRWGPTVLSLLGASEASQSPLAGFEAWRALPEWEDTQAPDKPGAFAIAPDDA